MADSEPDEPTPKPADEPGTRDERSPAADSSGGPQSPEAAGTPPRRDPWKGLRGVMAGTLILEAIVVLLALPVIARLGGGISGGGGVIVIVLAVALVLASGLLRTGWGLPLALALQLGVIACGLFQFSLGVLGGMFLLIWLYILWLRRDLMKRIEREQREQQ